MKKKTNYDKQLDKMFDNLMELKIAEENVQKYEEFLKWFRKSENITVLHENEALIKMMVETLKRGELPRNDEIKIAFCLGYWVNENHR